MANDFLEKLAYLSARVGALRPSLGAAAKDLEAAVAEVYRSGQVVHESAQRWSALCNALPAMIWRSDRDLVCRYFNRRWLEFTQRSLAEESSCDWLDTIHPDDRDECLKAYGQAFEMRQCALVEYRLRRADGRYARIQDRAVPLFTPAGDFDGYIGSCVDITEQRLVERRLREQHRHSAESERLGLLGEISDIMVHEIGQPLMALMNYVEGARRLSATRALDDSQLEALLDNLVAVTQRAAKALNKIRQQVLDRQSDTGLVDITEIVRTVLQLFSAEMDELSVRLHLDLSCDLPPVRGEAARLQLAVANLVRNAIEAMEGQGPEERRLSVRSGLSPAGEIELEVVDTGAGVAPQLATELFSPFVTTKAHGIGLGLSIVRRIVEAHGGRIVVDCRRASGAAFVIHLPVKDSGKSDAA